MTEMNPKKSDQDGRKAAKYRTPRLVRVGGLAQVRGYSGHCRDYNGGYTHGR